MSTIAFEIALVALLILGNGIFAMAEIALVAARRPRLKSMAEKGHQGAKLAIELSESPGRFLSTVQVGITLFGVVSGVVGGARIAGTLAEPFKTLPVVGPYADVVALILLSAVITVLSVVVGELVPKRLALQNPESIASFCARPMTRLSRLAGPLVSMLSSSTDLLLGALGIKKTADAAISDEEVRILIDEGLSTGAFRKEEKEMVEGVLDLDEQTVEDLMTPRARIVWLSLDDSDEENWRRIAGSGHSHFPVFQKTRDNVLGMVSVKSLWANLSLAGLADLRALVTPPLYVPTSMPAPSLIAEFKKTGRHIALVVDEFGGLQGLVTLNDLMEAIVGDLPERGQRSEPQALRREDGTWLVDAILGIEEFKKALVIEAELPDEEEFSTLGGFVIAQLGRIPKEGEKVRWSNYEFEVMDMDRLRVDKVLVKRLPPQSSDEPGRGSGVDSRGEDKSSSKT
jgi:putative hemolysin